MAAPLKNYIDRILTVLAEIDAKGSDKKEIYKELAAEGYDRTVVAQVVGHLRKKAAKPGKFAEQSQLFDLYLADYEQSGTVVATRTRHASAAADHDPLTGEILDTQSRPTDAPVASEAGHPSGDTGGQQFEPLPAAPLTAAQEAVPEGNRSGSSGRTEPSADGQTHPVAKTSVGNGGGNAPLDSAPASGDVSRPDAGRSASATPEIMDATVGGDESGTAVLSPAAPEESVGTSAATVSIRDTILSLRPHCQNPDTCASAGGKNHCFKCRKAAWLEGVEAA